MKKNILFCLSFFCLFSALSAQHYTISGKILEKNSLKPIEYAFVVLPNLDLAVITDVDGVFEIKNISAGTQNISVSCLGFQKHTFQVLVDKNIDNLEFHLAEDNLLLNEIVVTAEKKEEDLTTAYTIDRVALEQLQILNITEIASLLPGGQTSQKINLATRRGSATRFEFRTNNATDLGLPDFGTVVEVDGVRLSSNSLFSEGDIKGADTRSVASSNIESVEVITGVPSVEYGDLSNGMIRVKSKRGKSPLNVELSVKPNTKLAAFGKGFDLGNRKGILSASYEYAKSNSDLASPYTTYDRNNLSLTYTNTLGASKSNPLNLTLGFSGNIGGYNSKGDPDAFVDTYLKERDNTMRVNMGLDWLLNKSWITKVELFGTLSYSDLLTEEKKSYSSSSSTPAIHTKDQGYVLGELYADNPNAEIILIPQGYWYSTKKEDNKPVVYTLKMKANWSRQFGDVTNRFMVGSDFKHTYNRGKGIYYTDMQYAPNWREYEYRKQPAVNNLAIFIEDQIDISLPNSTSLRTSIGLRSDLTHINHSDYGTVNSLSPRLGAKYTFRNCPENTVSLMSIRTGFGDAVKLPASYILNPPPTYRDILVFAPSTITGSNTSYYAYNTTPGSAIYNSGLKWQRNRLFELEFNARIGQVNISLLAYNSFTINPYNKATLYTPYSYNFTDQSSLTNSNILEENRKYIIDKTTGRVTVIDKTGSLPSEQLAYTEKNTFKTNTYYYNEADFTRKGLEWIINFGKIQAIHTSFQIDGAYNYYKGLKTSLVQYSPGLSQNMADGQPYKYIGLYEGGSGISNGDLSKKVTNNLTVTTHIPVIRLMVSLRLESCLYNYKQNLSESVSGERGFVIDSRGDYLPSSSGGSIYDGNNFVVMYPLYYISLDDMDTKISFREKYLWAKDNDPTLFNELSKMVVRTNTNYYFKPSRVSAYFSANLNITKELGDHISVSFMANNFLNTISKIRNSQNDAEISLFDSAYVPNFYYGLTLKMKL